MELTFAQIFLNFLLIFLLIFYYQLLFYYKYYSPRYTYLRSDELNLLPRIKVTWQPFVDGNPGSHFYVQYR